MEPLARVSGGPVEGHGGIGPGLAFDFTLAPSSGVSLDLFAVPPLCAVAACGGLTTAALAGLRADADPGPGVGAVAATGVAGVPTDSEPTPGAVAAAGVARVAAEADAAPSSLISSSLQSISCAVKGRLALSCRLPYSSSRPFCQDGLSLIISCSTSSLRCFSKIQSRRCRASCAAERSPRALAAASWELQRPIW